MAEKACKANGFSIGKNEPSLGGRRVIHFPGHFCVGCLEMNTFKPAENVVKALRDK
jgi:hypothetical protein